MRILVISFLICILTTGNLSGKLSLMTAIGEVKLYKLEIGKIYSIKKKTNLYLSVVNRSSCPLDLKIDVVIPASGSLKPGYEPIPEKSWITFEKDYFPDVQPGEGAATDAIIHIPDNEIYCGKKYQATLWFHSVSKKGMSVAVGLNTRLMFSIKEKSEIKNVKIKEKKGIFRKLFGWLGL